MFDLNILNNYPYKMIWKINDVCNMNCEYCFFVNDEKEKISISPEIIINGFDNSNKNWLISFTGGEPFLYPDFMKILNKLSKNHYFIFATNLSTENIYHLPQTIPPERSVIICGSYHLLEREKIHNGKQEFINKYLFLQQHGFEIITNIILYPKIIDKIEDEITFLKDKGINNITLLTYRGNYNGKDYPQNLSEKEYNLLRKYAVGKEELIIASNKMNFFGNLCEAGNKYFFMDKYGNVKKCLASNRTMGNLFKGNFKPDNNLNACVSKFCSDSYTGLLVVKNKKASTFKLIKEKIKENKAKKNRINVKS